jgi:hypothetical protein
VVARLNQPFRFPKADLQWLMPSLHNDRYTLDSSHFSLAMSRLVFSRRCFKHISGTASSGWAGQHNNADGCDNWQQSSSRNAV